MALVLNEEQLMLRRSAMDFCKNTGPITHFRSLRDSKSADGFSRDVWKQMCELGWAGIAVDEAYGGLAFGWQGLGVVMETLGTTLVPSPLLQTVALGASLIEQAGSEELKSKYLPSIISGDTLVSLALEEEGRHRPEMIMSVAEKNPDGWIVNGRKVMVTDAHVADQMIIAVRTAGESDDTHGISLFMVPQDDPNLTINTSLLVDSRPVSAVSLNNLQVNHGQLLGEIDGGWKFLDQTLDKGRIILAAEMLGIATRSFEMTLDWLKEREQFGVPIGSFQALQHRAAHMFSEIEVAKSAVYKALTALEEDPSSVPVLASMAKAIMGELLYLVTNEAVQMHGGIGVTDEHDIGFYIKRARVAEMTFGDSVFHRDRYATLQGY